MGAGDSGESSMTSISCVLDPRGLFGHLGHFMIQALVTALSETLLPSPIAHSNIIHAHVHQVSGLNIYVTSAEPVAPACSSPSP